jgi:hypothetical protein
VSVSNQLIFSATAQSSPLSVWRKPSHCSGSRILSAWTGGCRRRHRHLLSSTSNLTRTLELSIISAPSCAATRKWMESVLHPRSSNDSPKNELVGAKYPLNTNTSPRGYEEPGGESPVTSPITSPPYWVQSHQRSASAISIDSIPNGAITLQDNTDGADAKNKACWAKSVYIEDHVVINGSRTGIGAFVVWNITVETLHVSPRFRI